MRNAESSQDRPARVLFADDSRLMRFAGQRILRDHFDVCLAEDGRNAWDRLGDDDRIRALITDLQMPVMDGVELIQRVRASSDPRIRGLPIMVVTSVEEKSGRRRALDAGANDLIPKPFSGSDLVDPLTEHMRRAPEAGIPRPASPPNIEQTRLTLCNRLEQVESFHLRHGLEFSLLHVRLDAYFDVVERRGLNHAEALMRHLERALAREVRTEDTLGRSDEATFTVILMATPGRGARRLSERLRWHLAHSPVRFPGHSVELKVSISIQSPGPHQARGAEELLRAGLARLAQPANVTRLSDHVGA